MKQKMEDKIEREMGQINSVIQIPFFPNFSNLIQILVNYKEKKNLKELETGIFHFYPFDTN